MLSPSSLIDKLIFIQKILALSAYPIWLAFGIIECLLNLIIFSRPQVRTTSCSIYFSTASIDHLLALLVSNGTTFYSMNNSDSLTQSIIFCKLRSYIFQICLIISRWFIVFACIDRFALTSSKFQFRKFSKPKLPYRAVIIIIFWFIICSYRPIFYEIDGNLCVIVTNMAAALYHSLYVIVGGGTLPAMIMIVCGCLIRRNLAHKQQIRVQFVLGDHH
ncbi:unnamed protein product [Rotaria magnacalcarata]|uniref:G-protein coupled receptors family 1 profile domain-containing protein n=1 Tax=Rotaria magnacalcarata TaxID=392030 RepID=A0A816Z1A3_9BILA|nr:unnamed protein product [Rotaria magnacalcarata]CAF2188836.1 unnamed protein product [Rotaria magnacalcarata]CAF3988934.1 unnamed protein product [Rotaria magnacalcarata]CAF4309766.1 unnamed protein product [Rotaria magnacalcarata]